MPRTSRGTLNGAPITFAGRLYYPAGPRIHFIPSEMIRTGDFLGIPLYARTTIEPYSVVFVPIGGGMLQPYERRRDGDLAGMVGSSAPSFPVALSSDSQLDNAYGPQAPAPPMIGPPDAKCQLCDEPVGTTGIVSSESAPVPLATLARDAGARRKDSANGIFINYQNARWFSSGPPVPFDPSRFVLAGEREGFHVYTARGGSRSTIFIPTLKDATDLVAPFTKRGR